MSASASAASASRAMSRASTGETVNPRDQELPMVPIKMSVNKGAGVCCVPCCPSGFNFGKKNHYTTARLIKKCKSLNLTPEHHIMFPVPMATVLYTPWRDRIPKRVDMELKRRWHHVCASHFNKEDMFEKPYVSVTDTGDKIKFDKKSLTYLKPQAVPLHFPGVPKYLINSKKPRKPPKKRLPLLPKPKPNEMAQTTVPTPAVCEEEPEILEGMETFEPTQTITPSSSPVMFEAYTPQYAYDKIEFTDPDDIPADIIYCDQSVPESPSHFEETSYIVQNQKIAPKSKGIALKRSQQNIIIPVLPKTNAPSISTTQQAKKFVPNILAKKSKLLKVDNLQESLETEITKVPLSDLTFDNEASDGSAVTDFQYIEPVNISKSPSPDKCQSNSPLTSLDMSSQPEEPQTSLTSLNIAQVKNDIFKSSKKAPKQGSHQQLKKVVPTLNAISPTLTSQQLETTTSHTVQVNYYGIPLANVPLPTSKPVLPLPSQLLKTYSNNSNNIQREGYPVNMELLNHASDNILTEAKKLPTCSKSAESISEASDPVKPTPFEVFAEMCSKVKLPSPQWAFQKHKNLKFISFSHVDVNESGNLLEKRIVFQGDTVVKVWFDGTYSKTYSDKIVSTYSDILYLLCKTDQLLPCPGTGYSEEPYSDNCDLYRHTRTQQCTPCKREASRIRQKQLRRMRDMKKSGKASVEKEQLNEGDKGATKTPCEVSQIEEMVEQNTEESLEEVTEKQQKEEEVTLEQMIAAAANAELLEQQQQLLAFLT